MKCPYCSKEISDNSRFCVYCGKQVTGAASANQKNPVNPRKSGRNRKAVAAAAVLIGTGAVASFFILKQPVHSEYQEAISAADRYLYELDYDKAEEYYLKAQTIEPKSAEAYSGLYEVYTEKNEPEKAKTVLKEAQESLGQSEFEKLDETIEETRKTAQSDQEKKEDQQDQKKQDNPAKTDSPKTVNGYAVEADLGTLDIAPVNVGEAGWVIVKDGKFGLVDSKGNIVNKPDGDSFSLGEKIDSSTLDQESYACVFDSGSSGSSASIQESKIEDSDCSPQKLKADAPEGVITINKDRELLVQTPQKTETYIEDSPETKGQLLLAPAEITDKKSEDLDNVFDAFEDRQFYIYSRKSNQVFGPYSKDDVPAFSKLRLNNKAFDQIRDSGILTQYFSEPFWVKDKDGYTVYSSDVSASRSGISKVEIVSPDAIGIFQDGKFLLLDEHLNELYGGEFESGSRGINGLTPVKTDGTWKLIRMDKSSGQDQEAQKEKEEKEKAEKEKAEKERQEQEAAAGFRDLAGSYSWSSGVGGWGCELNIQEDGLFEVYYHDSDMGVTGPDYPNGSAYSARFSGRLQKTSDQQVQMTQIALQNPAGTSEIIDGVKVDYISNDRLNMPEGSFLTVYPVGTAVASLPEMEKFQVNSHGYPASDGNTLLMPLLSNGSAIFIKWSE